MTVVEWQESNNQSATVVLLCALISVFQPDWLIRLKFCLWLSDNLHTELILTKTHGYPQVKQREGKKRKSNTKGIWDNLRHFHQSTKMSVI